MSVYFISDTGVSPLSTSTILSPANTSVFNVGTNWAPASAVLGKIRPGDTVTLVGTVSTALAFQTGGTVGNPITLFFSTGSSMVSSAWSFGQGAIYLNNISNVIIDGGGLPGMGGVYGNPNLANGVIACNNNGTLLGNQISSSGITMYDSSNVTIRNLLIKNLYAHVANSLTDLSLSQDGAGVVLLGSNGNRNNIVVNNCIFHDCITGVTVNYLATCTNYVVSNCTMYNCNWCVGIGDQEANSTLNNVYIYGNRMYSWSNWDCIAVQSATVVNGGSGYNVGDQITPNDTTGSGAVLAVSAISNAVVPGSALGFTTLSGGGSYHGVGTLTTTTITGSGSGCTVTVIVPDSYHHDGVIAYADFSGSFLNNLNFYNNVVGPGYGLAATAGIYCPNGYCGVVNVYNNVFLSNSGEGNADANVYSFAYGASAVFNIYHNTFLANGTGAAINVSLSAFNVEFATLTNSITANIFNNLSVNNTFIEVFTASAVYLNSNYNLGYNLLSTGAHMSYSNNGTGLFKTWPGTWQALNVVPTLTSGGILNGSPDQNSVAGGSAGSGGIFNPNLGSNFIPNPSSPAHNAGSYLLPYSLVDATGRGRPLTPTIGAFESYTSNIGSIAPQITNNNQYSFNTWYVCQSATGLNNGTSLANAWNSLSSMTLSSVSPGDTVYFYQPGNYQQLVITTNGTSARPITFKGLGTPGVNGITFTGVAGTNVNGIKLLNFEITQGSCSFFYSGVTLTNCNYWLIQDNFIHKISGYASSTSGGNSGQVGVSLAFNTSNNYNVIRHNTFQDMGTNVTGQTTGISTASVGPNFVSPITPGLSGNPGSGYSVNDVLTLTTAGSGGAGAGAQVRVTAAPGGVPTTFAVVASGTGYTNYEVLSTFGGTGTGCSVLVTITQNVGVSVIVYGNNNIVEYNTMGRGNDRTNVFGQYNIVRNNYMSPMLQTDLPGTDPHCDDFQSFNGSGAFALQHTLFERNFSSQNNTGNAHGQIIRDTTGASSLSAFISRFNISSFNGSNFQNVQALDKIYTYNNTISNAQMPATAGQPGGNGYVSGNPTLYALLTEASSAMNQSGTWINNTFYNSQRSTSTSEIIFNSASGFNVFEDYNHTYPAGSAFGSHSLPKTVPQNFNNLSAFDFTLSAGSQLIGAGGSLTYATNSGSNSVYLTVNDPFGLSDGWGSIDADKISIGGGPYVSILGSSLNYNTASLNLMTAQTWVSGALIRVLGMNDIGALPSSYSPPNSSVSILNTYPLIVGAGQYTLTTIVSNVSAVRYIEYLVDGISIGKSYVAPYYPVSYNYDGNLHTIEYRVYCMWASQSPTISQFVIV